MFNVIHAGGHMYGKQLFTWLSLVVFLMASFCAVLFPTRYLRNFLPTLMFAKVILSLLLLSFCVLAFYYKIV